MLTVVTDVSPTKPLVAELAVIVNWAVVLVAVTAPRRRSVVAPEVGVTVPVFVVAPVPVLLAVPSRGSLDVRTLVYS